MIAVPWLMIKRVPFFAVPKSPYIRQMQGARFSPAARFFWVTNKMDAFHRFLPETMNSKYWGKTMAGLDRLGNNQRLNIPP